MFSAWVTVAVKDRLEALLIQSWLQTEGILVRLKGEAVGNVYVFSTGPLGQVEVQVPEQQALRARAVLDAADKGELSNGS